MSSRQSASVLGLRLALALSLLLGVGAGYWWGYRQGSAARVVKAAQPVPLPGAVRPSEAPLESEQQAGWAYWLAQRDWRSLTRWLQATQNAPSLAQRRALLAALAQTADRQEASQQIALLRVYLEHDPYNGEAQLLVADLMEMQGGARGALFYLLTVIAYPPDEATARQAQQAADRILTVLRNQLRTAENWPELLWLWQELMRRAPANDRYRFDYAQTLVQMAQYDDALDVLAQTGVQGVSQDEIDALVAQVRQLRSGLRFERDGDKLLANAQVDGVNLRLLVDTGATITSLSQAALRRVRARPTGSEVSLRTASGVVSSPLYVVPELVVQGRRIERLTVAQLPLSPVGLDGLLGVDVLQQLGGLSRITEQL